MATKAQQAVSTQRDVSLALRLAKQMQLKVEPALANTAAELVQLLTDIDARTGRRDPSARKKAGLHQRNGK